MNEVKENNRERRKKFGHLRAKRLQHKPTKIGVDAIIKE